MSDSFAQSIHDYLLPTGSQFSYDPFQKQIQTLYMPNQEDLMNFTILASQSGLNSPIYYNYGPGYFTLYWLEQAAAVQSQYAVPAQTQYAVPAQSQYAVPAQTQYAVTAQTQYAVPAQIQYAVPADVQGEARIALAMHDLGYNGGTDTGYERAQQLINGRMDIDTLRVMRNWFARHRYVSYPGYQGWVSDGKPQTFIKGRKNSYRGAVAWLLWGGDAAYQWIKSSEIQNALNASYSDKDNSLP